MNRPTAAKQSQSNFRNTFSRLLSTITRQSAARDKKLKLLLDGAVIAERYQILGFIAAGAHGQVYRAMDLELGQEVALKLLHPSLAESPKMVERFKKELLIARQVTHKNVCRVFDVCRTTVILEQVPTKILFITMELVNGRTLAEFLEQQKKPFDPQQTIELIRQVIAGLHEAHQHRFVHGDVKASNIILSEQPGEGVRAVVTDFGLSHVSQPNGQSTGSAKMEGTPLYMAPEQVSGKPLSPETDVYALGVLMYRMLTGQWPFLEDTALLTALKRLYVSPADSSKLIQAAGKETAKAVMKCLQREPEDRFRSLEELDKALANQQPVARRLSRFKPAVAIPAVAVVLALVGAGYFYFQRQSTPRIEPSGIPLRPAIAVLPLTNETDDSDLDWLGAATQRAMIERLRRVDAVRTIGSEQVGQLLLQAEQQKMTEDFQWISKTSGADLSVTGQFRSAADGQVELDIRLTDVAREASLYESQLMLDREALDQAGDQLTERLLAHLQIRTDQPGIAGANQPVHLVALSNYSQGLDLLDQLKPDQAIGYLQAALQQQPDHPLIESALADAQLNLGRVSESVETLKQALEHSKNLDRRERLSIEGRLHLAERNFQRATEIYRALIEFYPDELEYGLALSQALAHGGDLAAAFDTLGDLRKLPDGIGDDVRIDLLQAELGAFFGDFESAGSAALAALEKAENSRTPLVRADALRWHARVIYYSDAKLAEAVSALRTARQIYTELGIDRSVADVATALADMFRVQANGKLSEELYQEAVYASEAVGDSELKARIMNGRANLLSGQGEFAEALQIYQQILADKSVANNPHLVGLMHHNVGTTAVKLGDLDLGWQHLSLSQEIYEKNNDRFGLMIVNYAMGSFWKAKGELKPADISFKEALRLAETVNSDTWAAYAQLEIADIAGKSGDYQGAVETASTVFELFLARGQETRAAGVGLTLAGFLLSTGDFKRAGEVAEQTRILVEKHSLKHSLGHVHGVLAQVSAHFDEPEKLKTHLTLATQALPQINLLESRLSLQSRLAMVGYDSGVFDTDHVKDQLEQVRSQALSNELVLPLLRSDYNLAILARDDGDTDLAGQVLQSVIVRSKEAGYQQLADQAEDIRETMDAYPSGG